MKSLSKYKKMQRNIESVLKNRGLYVRNVVVEWVSRQQWKENDYVYFIVFGIICLSFYNIMIMSKYYWAFNISKYWPVLCGIGFISVGLGVWAYEQHS